MVRLFKHYIPLSLIALSIGEFAVFVLSVYAGGSIRFSEAPNELPDDVFWPSVLFAAVMFACMTSMGLYQRHLRDGRRGMFLRIVIAFFLGFIAMTLLFYLFPEVILGRGIFGITWLIAFLAIIAARLFYIKRVNREDLKRRVIVAGVGKNANLIDTLLKRHTDRLGFKVIGYVPVNEEEICVDRSKVIEHNMTFVQLSEIHDVDEIVIAVTDRRKGMPVEELLDCKMSGIDVIDLQTFFERQTGKIILDLLQPSWLIFSDGFGQGRIKDVSKRIFDLLASGILLLATFPFMLITMVAIYLEDRGPVFYRQVRVGQNWKLIKVVKFRSMRIDAEKAGAQFAQKDDDRVTRVGKFIRKTRIDELPQLLNVFKGEMSFVGPRPERPEFVEDFSKNIPFYSERHRVKPGITGWAQIMYPYGSDEKDTIQKLQYDLYYVKNYSVFLDVTVLFQTAEVILWGKGAR